VTREFIGWLIGCRTDVALSKAKCGWLLTMQWRPHWLGNTYRYTGVYTSEEDAKTVALRWIEELRGA